MKWRLLKLTGFKRKTSDRDCDRSQESPSVPQPATSSSTSYYEPSSASRARPSPPSFSRSALSTPLRREQDGDRVVDESDKDYSSSEASQAYRGGAPKLGRRETPLGTLAVTYEGAVSFGQAIDFQEQQSYSSEPISRATSFSPSTELDHSSRTNFALGARPLTLHCHPSTLTRSSTINTLSSSRHARRSSSSSRSRFSSSSPPSTPNTSPAPSLRKISTRLDLEGRRVLSRRRSTADGPEKLHRVRGSFGVLSGEETSSDDDLKPRPSLARSRSSMPPFRTMAYDADVESTDTLSSLARSVSTGEARRRRSLPVVSRLQSALQDIATDAPRESQVFTDPRAGSTSPTTPRAILNLPQSSSRRAVRPRPVSNLSFTTIQQPQPIAYIEGSSAPTPRPSSLHRRSTVAFLEPASRSSFDAQPQSYYNRSSSLRSEGKADTLYHPSSSSPATSQSDLARSSVQFTRSTTLGRATRRLAQEKRRETLTLEPRFLEQQEDMLQTRTSLEHQDHLEREASSDWWEFTAAREKTKGRLKVVNPDQAQSSFPSSPRPSTERTTSNRSSYYSASSIRDISTPTALAV